MTNRAALLISVFTPVVLAVACQSSSDDSANAAGSGGSSSGGTVPSAGTAGHGGAGSPLPTAGAGANGAAAGASSAHAGAGGRGGAGGSAGAAGGVGQSEGGEAAANSGEAGTGAVSGEGGAGNEAGAANGGEAGAANPGPPEYAYVSTILGGVVAFSLDREHGTPSLLTGSPIDVGPLLYAESVNPAQRLLYVVDQAHKLDTFPINADGTLPATPAFSAAIIGNPVTLALDPAGHFAYVGTQSDTQTIIEAFHIDAITGALTSAGDPLALTAAPAYVAVDPTGHFAYVSEVGGGIWGYHIDPITGALSKIDGSPFGAALVFRGAIAFTPSGGFLYTTGGGLNAFSIDTASGKLEPVEGSPFSPDVGSDPSATNIAIEPSGRFLYATEFVGIALRLFGFSIAADGKLDPVEGLPVAASQPYSVGVDPSGHFLYLGQDDGHIGVFSLNLANGKLHEIDGSPFAHGGLQPEFAFATAR
jgi:6-phosphogluconolactonase